MKNYERRILCKPRKLQIVIYFGICEVEIHVSFLELFVDQSMCVKFVRCEVINTNIVWQVKIQI